MYDALLELLQSDNNCRVPEHFLRDIKGDDKEVLGKLLNVLIQKCCRNGMWPCMFVCSITRKCNFFSHCLYIFHNVILKNMQSFFTVVTEYLRLRV